MELYSIIDTMIKNRFPELSDIEIQLNLEESDDEFTAYGKLDGGGYYINVDKTLQQAPVPVIQGALAHELVHISLDKGMNFIVRFFDGLLYQLCSWYETYDERKTDLLVIKRGYGEQLLAFSKFANEEYEEYTAEDGLTAEEIEKILRDNANH